MWVLINNEGQIVTSIPHGEIIRQGSSFSVYVAFERNYFDKIIEDKTGSIEHLAWTIEELRQWLDDYVGVQVKFKDTPIQILSPNFMTFHKIKDNESICSFKDNKDYIVYKYFGDSSYTEDFGSYPMIIRMSTVDRKDENGDWDQVDEHRVYVDGIINIYIEPTYGYTPKIAEVTYEQIDYLIDFLNNKLNSKININDEKVVKLESTYTDLIGFANDCLNKKNEKGLERIFIGLVEQIGEDYLTMGIVGADNSVLIMSASGVIGKVKDDDIEFVETPRLNVDKLLTGNVDLKQNAIFNATKGVVLVPKPIDKEQVANKEYVDEEVKKVKQEATSILSSYIKYVEDEEED